MKTAYLCIVIVNYRTPGLVLDCLRTTIDQAESIDAQIVVVDNASHDDSVERIQAWIQQNQCSNLVKLIPSGINGGFSAGNNLGIQAVDAEYYLLANSDSLLRDGVLTDMLTAMEAHPDAGLLSPRLEWPNGDSQESCFRYHTPISQFIDSCGTGFFLRFLGRYEVAHRISPELTRPDWTSFAFVLIRKEVFDRIGLLDEKYFMYFEDVEFCYRAKAAGWEIVNVPQAKAVHLRGGSSPVKSNMAARKRQPRYYYESRTRYFFSVFGHLGLLFANIMWTLGWLFACVRACVQPSFKVPACKLEYKDIWINFLRPDSAYVHPDDYN